jgi:hypothetical protein
MTTNSYSSLCDDFYLDMYINTILNLPTERDTILTFFERLQKQFPSMSRFYRREKNQFVLEEDRDIGQYRWVTIETDRIGSGVVNPSNLESAYNQHKLILELCPYMLSVSHLDIDSLDVTFAMDFDYTGNHDEVIAEALLGTSAFSCFFDWPSSRVIDFSPSVIVALSDDQNTQAQIYIESKTTIYEPQEERQSTGEAIGLSVTIRRYNRTGERFDALKSFEYQCRLAEELMAEKIVPNFVKPLIQKIAQNRSTSL